MKDKLREPFLVLSGIFSIGAIVSGALLAHLVYGTFNSSDVSSHNDSNERLEEEEEENFQYELRTNATDFQRVIFDDLIKACDKFNQIRSEENIKSYAGAIVKNFIADFYTWSNKDNRADVGGLQFMASSIKANFKSYTIDNFYLYLNQYIEMYGQDSLLAVSDVRIEEVVLDYQFELSPDVDEEAVDQLDSQTVSVIRVEATWEYDNASFVEGEYFQQKATFFLTEEGNRISIQVIQEANEDTEIYY